MSDLFRIAIKEELKEELREAEFDEDAYYVL